MRTYYILNEKDSYRIFENLKEVEEYYKDNNHEKTFQDFLNNLTISIKEDSEDKIARRNISAIYRYCQTQLEKYDTCYHCIFNIANDGECLVEKLCNIMIE